MGKGSSLVSLPCLDGLFIKCRVLDRKGPLEGTPRSPRPGLGLARAPNSLTGTPGKSPLSRFSAPQTQSGRSKRGELAFVNSNVRCSTPGEAFVNNLPFLVSRAEGLSPPTHANRPLSKKPLKPGLGFLSFYIFFFSFSFLTSSWPPPPDSPSPLPSLLPHPPPPLPSVE